MKLLIDVSSRDKNSGVIVPFSNAVVQRHSWTVSCVSEQSKENFIFNTIYLHIVVCLQMISATKQEILHDEYRYITNRIIQTIQGFVIYSKKKKK